MIADLPLAETERLPTPTLPDLSRFLPLVAAAKLGQVPRPKMPVPLSSYETTTDPGQCALGLWSRMKGLWRCTIAGDGLMKPRAYPLGEVPLPQPEWARANAWADFDAASARLDTIRVWWEGQS